MTKNLQIQLIEKTVFNIQQIQKIDHGKSSDIFLVETVEKTYIFKFPKTNYQNLSFIKERFNCNLFYDLLDVKTPFINITDYKGLKCIFYEAIDGRNLSDVFFDTEEIKCLAKQLSKLLKQFNEIGCQNRKVLSLKTKKEELLEFSRDFGYVPKFNLIQDILDENETVIHGDFHRSNILVDQNKNICGLLDFATVCYGSLYFDIGHMIFSMSEPFNTYFLLECENQFKRKFDKDKIDRILIFLDDLINKHYLPYIKGDK